MHKHILVLNAGSSSLKFAAFNAYTFQELDPATGFAEGLALLMPWLERKELHLGAACAIIVVT